MLRLFSTMLSLCGLAAMVWLISQRRHIAQAFGGADRAFSLMGFALVTTAAPLVAASAGSLIMGLSALGMLSWMLLSSTSDSLMSSPDPWLRLSWLMVGVLAVWCFGVDSLVGFGLYGPTRIMGYVAAAVLFLAIGLMSGRVALDTRAVTYIGLCVLSVLTMPTYFVTDAWRPCTTGLLEKCSVAGALFKSFYGSENYIAILASFTFVACLCSLRRAQLLAVASFCLLIIVATGSRSSFLGIGAACTWLAVGLILERRRQYFRVPALVCFVTALSAAGTAMYLAWSASPTTLSNRGRIWISAREYLSEMTITGVGVSKWYFLRDVGESPQHFFHSSYVLLLFSGGFVALASWTLWAAALLRGVVEDGRAFSAKTPVVLLFIYSLTEVVWNPISVDSLSWIIVAVMLTQSASPNAGAASAGEPTAEERASAGLRKVAKAKNEYLSAGFGPHQKPWSRPVAARTIRETS